jgi:hypothetical protein
MEDKSEKKHGGPLLNGGALFCSSFNSSCTALISLLQNKSDYRSIFPKKINFIVPQVLSLKFHFT